MTATDPATGEVRHLPPLDKAAETKAAHAWVRTQLAGLKDPAARAKRAAAIVDDETAEWDRVRPLRDAAAYTLVLHYRIRRGAAINDALGVQRSAWQVIRERQAARVAAGTWPGPIENAPNALPELAAETFRHKARADYALEVRNQAVQRLLKSGLRNAEIARIIGIDPSGVSTIRHHKESAA